MESLSAYARQFLGQMDKPDVDYIEGLSPAISIDQKGTSRNPRSTVATVTEVYDYMRLLWARIGQPHCPQCGRPISQQSVDQIVDSLMNLPEGSRIQVLAPVIRGKKGEHRKVFDELRRDGYVRVRVNGEVRELSGEITLERYKIHNIEAVVDRLVIRSGVERRLADSVETALKLGDGLVVVDAGGCDRIFSERLACPECSLSFGGAGAKALLVQQPLRRLPHLLRAGREHRVRSGAHLRHVAAIERRGPSGRTTKTGSVPEFYMSRIFEVARVKGIDADVPLGQLSPEQMEIIRYGCGPERFTFTYRDSHGRLQQWQSRFEGSYRTSRGATGKPPLTTSARSWRSS